jgi:glycosyltransferase involved in cell wall biosynthesis
VEGSRRAAPRAGAGPLDGRWRESREQAQEGVLPAGRVVVSCSAPLGQGGLGRHVQEILDALARRGSEGLRIGRDAASEPRASGVGASRTSGAGARRSARPRAATLIPTVQPVLAPVARRSPAWSAWLGNAAFDAAAARRLPAADHLIAFNGEALQQLRVARVQSVALVSATSHVRRVVRIHARARAQYPLEGSWATCLVGRSLAEYAQADRIYVSSRHVWESFVQEGVAEERLSLFPLIPAARFTREQASAALGAGRSAEVAAWPGARGRAGAEFRIVYVGGLSVVKGVPLLIDAVRRLAHPDIRLVLVGGWGTRGMRRFVQRACAADDRIEVCPGDPLGHLRGAALCVHPSYEDGFGYAPVEAMACGVPVIVSENTGMKELVDPGRDGLVLPTGDRDALTEAIDAAYRREILL